MRTRPLGPGAPAVSSIGFGGMPLSISGRPSEEQAIRTIHAALDAGATLIDTADVYCLDDNDLGHNERLIAKALGSWAGPRDHLIVATKGGLTRPGGRWERHGHPDHLRRACDRSLRALGVERIDLYQFHAPDSRVSFLESVGALAQLRTQGKVRWVGLSNVSVPEIEDASRLVPITTVQNRLSPFFREALRDGVVAHCAEQRIGFLAYSPVGGGRLNRKLPGHPVLRPIAERLGASTHAVTLAWVLAQGATVIPIPGSRTPEHARDAIAAADLPLAPEDLTAIDRAVFRTD
ncbi:MAG: aldo/keto reductase [Gemmatimonadetes bacterium]|nr:aldo/keto reductase [Gemmatimonadota bacterium]